MSRSIVLTEQIIRRTLDRIQSEKSLVLISIIDEPCGCQMAIYDNSNFNTHIKICPQHR